MRCSVMVFGTLLGPIVTNRQIIGRSTDSFRKFYKVVCMNLQPGRLTGRMEINVTRKVGYWELLISLTSFNSC